jgi:hypothetical protein
VEEEGGRGRRRGSGNKGGGVSAARGPYYKVDRDFISISYLLLKAVTSTGSDVAFEQGERGVHVLRGILSIALI